MILFNFTLPGLFCGTNRTLTCGCLESSFQNTLSSVDLRVLVVGKEKEVLFVNKEKDYCCIN